MGYFRKLQPTEVLRIPVVLGLTCHKNLGPRWFLAGHAHDLGRDAC
jgi:hypothetical protein